MKRVFIWVLGCLLWAASARANEVADLARIHVEAIGGRERIEQLRALRATGQVLTSGKTLTFELIAQRPNRVRVTVRADGKTLVQATDGGAHTWRWEPEKSPRAVKMGVEEALDFVVDAEFDDPLATTSDRGYAIDYAGETLWQGRRMLKVLVTRKDAVPAYLLLDPDTFFIMARQTTRTLPSGRTVGVETRYEDFRPVAGVIFPHRLAEHVDGLLVRETLLTLVLPVAEVPLATFLPPSP